MGMNGGRLNMNLGEKIRSTRAYQGLKQKDIADKLGITVQAVSQYERNIRIPTDKILNSLSNILSTDLSNYKMFKIGIRFLDIHQLPNEKEQIIKVVEEMYEFLNAAGDENQLEEFYDLVQSALNLLQIRGFNLKEIEEAEQKHVEKLRKRGWNI